MSNTSPVSMAAFLLTAKQAAEILAVSPRTLWSITQPRGELPCVRIGRAVRYDPADLRDWIEKKKGGADQ
ncbi:MAG: helix-turn-helix domain-containing protein [Candidatus Nealsonbacteria bacterium]|nr:helix-turn-helix domain-containing protein [Candidatus Nealsonbacteria bacterium]